MVYERSKKEDSIVEIKENLHSQVLQRKTEEAAMATKRLKELLEARKSSPREHSGIIDGDLWDETNITCCSSDLGDYGLRL